MKIKITTIIIMLLLVNVCTGCNTSLKATNTQIKVNKIIDIDKITNKTKIEVKKIMGAPLDTDKWDKKPYIYYYYGDKNLDGDYKIEILFMNDIARIITIRLNQDEFLSNHSDNLQYIGLPSGVEMTTNEVGVTKWVNNYNGLYRISVNASLNMIKVITDEKYSAI